MTHTQILLVISLKNKLADISLRILSGKMPTNYINKGISNVNTNVTNFKKDFISKPYVDRTFIVLLFVII